MQKRRGLHPLAFFFDQKIGIKILAGYLITVLLGALAGGVAVAQLSRANATVARLAGPSAEERALAEQIAVQIQQLRLVANEYIYQGRDPAVLDTYNQVLGETETLLNRADQTITEANRVELLMQVRTSFDSFAGAFAEIAQLLAARQATVDQVLTPQGKLCVGQLASLRDNSFETLDFTSADYASQARDTFGQAQLDVFQYLATGDEKEAAQADADFASLRSTFDLLHDSVRDDASRGLLGAINAAATAYQNGFQQIRASAARQHTLVTTQLDVAGPQIDQAAAAIADSVNAEFTAQSQATSTLVARTRLGVLVTIGLAVVAGLAFGLALSRAITRPIEQMARAAKGLAGGALEQTVEVRTHDELGILAEAFNDMTAQLRAMLTAQQESLTSLQTSEERFRVLVEQAPEAIVVYDVDLDRFVDANTNAERLFGRSRQELLGSHLARFESSPPGAVSANERALRGEVVVFEQPVHSAAGQVFDCEVRLSRLPAADRRLVRASVIDITARKEMEEALRHTRNYLDNILNSMPSIVVGVDAEGRVTHWNRRAGAETGMTPEQAYGRRLEEALPQVSAYLEQVQEAVHDRQPRTLEKVAVQRAGERRYDDVLIFPLVANGVEGAVIRVDDVTEQVRIETLMVQTEKMMMVGGLAAGTAHEINNPLGGILQAAQNIERRLSLDLPANVAAAEALGVPLDRIRAYLDRREIFVFLGLIREAGTRAARIVTNMLQFSRQSDAQRQPTVVNELLDHAVELAASDYDLKKKYDFRHIAIVRDYDPALPPVSVAPTEIEQVILNLLKNAAHALLERSCAKEPGQEPRITLRTRREEGWAVIQVADNGCGMEEAVRKRVFEPFFTTKEAGVGTGLGLSVSYMIITNNHKGTIEVESAPGQGATFTLRLPLERRG